jgi:hypothetical protein
MKKIVGSFVVVVLLIAGTSVLRRQQNKSVVSPAERQTLRDALQNNPPGGGDSTPINGQAVPSFTPHLTGNSQTMAAQAPAAAQGHSNLDLFKGKFKIAKCTTAWKEGDRSNLVFSYSLPHNPIYEVLPQELSATGTEFNVELNNDALMIYEAGSNSNYSYISFKQINEAPVENKSKGIIAPPQIEQTGGDAAYPEYGVVNDVNLNMQYDKNSLGTKFQQTKAGLQVKQIDGDENGERYLLCAYLCGSKDYNNREKTLTLLANGNLEYHVHAKGKEKESRAFAGGAWDVMQVCDFQRE